MNNEHDKQDELQRVLALKRHERPPPRFFKGFSDKVIDRLHSPEPPADQTWWQRLGLDIDSKPLLVCASGIVVCGLLGVGLLASLRVERPKPVPRSPDDQSQFVVAPPVNVLTAPAPQIAPVVRAEEMPGVGDPVMVSESSPFSQIKLQSGRTIVKPAGSGSGGN